MKFIYFLIFLTIFSLLWLTFSKEYKIKSKKYKDITQIVFENFITYEINSSGLKDKLIGKVAKKYKNRVEMFDFSYQEKNSSLRAKRGVYKNSILYFYKNVIYKSKDFRFFTSKAIYDTKKKILKSRSKFILLTKSSKILGKDLIYNRNIGKILAKKIDATIYEKKSR